MLKKLIVSSAIVFSAAAAQADERFALLDQDASGTLSKEEAVAMPELAAAWGQLDVDADGQLTPEEFSRFQPGDQEMMQKGMEMKDKLSSDTK